MKTNVEVLEKQERELTVCDSCGREVDDDGQTCECDFCSVCAPNYTPERKPSEGVLTVDEWKSEDADDASLRQTFGVNKSLSLFVALSAITGWLCAAASVEPEWAVVPIAFMTVATVIGVIIYLLSLWDFSRKYVQTLEDRGDQR